MKEGIEFECETCKKKLKTFKQYKKCFQNNHQIHISGLFIIKDGTMGITGECRKGIALTNAKAGESVIVRI